MSSLVGKDIELDAIGSQFEHYIITGRVCMPVLLQSLTVLAPALQLPAVVGKLSLLRVTSNQSLPTRVAWVSLHPNKQIRDSGYTQSIEAEIETHQQCSGPAQQTLTLINCQACF